MSEMNVWIKICLYMYSAYIFILKNYVTLLNFTPLIVFTFISQILLPEQFHT